MSRAIVAIETATETVAVAVRTATGVEAELSLTGRRRHVETLTPALAHLLDQVGLTPADLEVVAVDVGPGLFTGLRVGVAAAKGLAQARHIGVVGATSLEILTAAAAAAGHGGLVLACVDARRAEVFAAVGEGPGGTQAGWTGVGPGLFAPDELATALATLGGVPVVAVGDGAQRYRSELEAVPGVHVAAPALAFPPPRLCSTWRWRASRAVRSPWCPEQWFRSICGPPTRGATSPAWRGGTAPARVSRGEGAP